jgi:hypothetical protein
MTAKLTGATRPATSAAAIAISDRAPPAIAISDRAPPAIAISDLAPPGADR